VHGANVRTTSQVQVQAVDARIHAPLTNLPDLPDLATLLLHASTALLLHVNRLFRSVAALLLHVDLVPPACHRHTATDATGRTPAITAITAITAVAAIATITTITTDRYRPWLHSRPFTLLLLRFPPSTATPTSPTASSSASSSASTSAPATPAPSAPSTFSTNKRARRAAIERHPSNLRTCRQRFHSPPNPGGRT
jgi:hypothetical protein